MMSIDHIIQLLTEALAAVAALLAFFKALKVSKQVHEVHLSINSRLDEMLTMARQEAHAVGRSEGIVAGTQAAKDLVKDALVSVVTTGTKEVQ